MRPTAALGLLTALAALPAGAAEFRSVAEAAAVLYDAPSVNAKKLFILGRDTPVEIVVSVEGWNKVRDASGELTWIESKRLAARRMLQVKVRSAEVRTGPEDGAALVFTAAQSVVLELVEAGPAGWARIRHADGAGGFIRASQVFGL